MIACGTDWPTIIAVAGFFGTMVLFALAAVVAAWKGSGR